MKKIKKVCHRCNLVHSGSCPNDPKRLFNSSEWRKYCAILLAQEPLCRFCKAQGKTTAAVDCHHAGGRHNGNAEDFFRQVTEGLIVPLCKLCHLKETRQGK